MAETALPIEVEDLSAGYGGVAVVRNISLSVRPGEVVGLLGPNGAGKTTTLLAISGLLKPMTGSVSVFGAPVSSRRPYLNARLGLAHVPEERCLFYQLSVEDNLNLGLSGPRSRRAGIRTRILDLFPVLKSLLKRRAGVLSGGEQQMLALARALCSEPKALLIDEMSLGLAPVIVERMLPLVRNIADEVGCAVLLVEQHLYMALEVVDRALVLNRGRIAMSGEGVKLLDDPSLLESSYLGSPESDPEPETQPYPQSNGGAADEI